MNIFGDPNAELMLLSWGSPKGAILDALEALWAEKLSVCFVQCRLLSPPAQRRSERTLREREASRVYRE
ncbi:MAG: hypothetical protein RMJ90_02700 [Candidatus Bipolaricaulota bacterium]|nr:hypothetical protein [Candidatus Bipolaricaulota bacterium]